MAGTMGKDEFRRTGGWYADQWTVRDEYMARAIDGACLLLMRKFEPYDPSPDEIAEQARRIADAMLAERARKPHYTDARGAVVPPDGAPSAEGAIRQGRGQQVVCMICGEPGHIVELCPYRHGMVKHVCDETCPKYAPATRMAEDNPLDPWGRMKLPAHEGEL